MENSSFQIDSFTLKTYSQCFPLFSPMSFLGNNREKFCRHTMPWGKDMLAKSFSTFTPSEKSVFMRFGDDVKSGSNFQNFPTLNCKLSINKKTS